MDANTLLLQKQINELERKLADLEERLEERLYDLEAWRRAVESAPR